jgi:malate synthase
MIAMQTDPVLIVGPKTGAEKRILTPQALRFLVKLATMFEPRRRRLLEARRARQKEIEQGWMPDFSTETAEIRRAPWKVAPIPADLQDRRVEITGPTDRKTILQSMNSGANVFVADFEDANSPTWHNMLEGQGNLCDAVNGSLTHTTPEGKHHELHETPAVLVVRPRGWHMVEKHVLIDGEPLSASLFDFGLYFFHNARTLIRNGTAPYFYLPKLENHQEARLWNDVFLAAQSMLGISRGTIRATVLVENVLAAFEMDEILWELREHSSGLNYGRWDYLFSYIRKFRHTPQRIVPDRASVKMTTPFLSSCVDLLIATCHRRSAHAIGGMAAQIPIPGDTDGNAACLSGVRDDKLREVWAGHDGTWVAHPGLVPLARFVFDTYMPLHNQIERRCGSTTTASDLLCGPRGPITEEGVALNLDVGLRYLSAWLGGNGRVAVHNRTENAATAEVCRAQLWQWMRHNATLDDGRNITPALVLGIMDAQVERLRGEIPEGRLRKAAGLYESLIAGPDFPEFLTLPAYEQLD